MHTSRVGKAEDWRGVLGAEFVGWEASWSRDLLVPNAGFTRFCGSADVRLARCELDDGCFFGHLQDFIRTSE